MKRLSIFLWIILGFLILQCGDGPTETKTETDNNGDFSWKSLNGPFGSEVLSLIIDNTGNIIAGADIGMFISSNNGDSWNEMEGALPEFTAPLGFTVNGEGDIFAATFGPDGGSIYKKKNNSDTWSRVGSFGSFSVPLSLTVDNLGYIYVTVFSLTGASGVYQSVDNGIIWARKYGNSNDFIVMISLAVNAEGHIFAGGLNGIVRSKNNGNSWEKFDFTQGTVNSLLIDADGQILAGVDNGEVYRSADNGSTWSQLSDLNAIINNLKSDSNGNIYAATSGGLYLSTDDAISWILITSQDTEVFSLAVSSNEAVYAGTAGDGVIRSTNSGTSWDQFGLGYAPITTLKSNLAGSLFAGSASIGVFRTTNGGSSWERTIAGLSSKNINTIDINFSGDIFVGTDNGGVFRSIDNANSWEAVNVGLDPDEIKTFAFNSDGNIFVGGDAWPKDIGLYSSTTNGDFWRETTLIEDDVITIVIDPDDAIYVGTPSGIFLSTDNGENWTELYNEGVHTLTINHAGDIFAGTSTGIFRRQKDVDEWILAGLDGISINSLLIDSQDHIFVASSNVIYLSTDNGDNWVEISDGLTGSRLTSLALDSKEYLYVGTFFDGVYVSSSSTVDIEN